MKQNHKSVPPMKPLPKKDELLPVKVIGRDIRVYNLVVYPVSIMTVIGKGRAGDINKLVKPADEDYTDFAELEEGDLGGTYFGRDPNNDDRSTIVIYLPTLDDDTMRTVVHECGHSMLYIANFTGLSLTPGTDEAACYLLDTIYGFVDDAIKAAKKAAR